MSTQQPDRPLGGDAADDQPTVEIPRQTTPASADTAGDPLAVFTEPQRTTSPGPATGTTTAVVNTTGPGPHVSTGPRATTIVWGLIVIAIGAGLLARTAGARIDLELAAILTLAAAGLLLVVGAIGSAVRRRRT